MNLKGKKCPVCGKKTLSHPPLKEWPLWKDSSMIICRKCKTKFKIKDKPHGT